MAEIEKAKAKPRILTSLIAPKLNVCLSQDCKPLSIPNAETKLKLRIIFKRTVKVAIRAGVFVSWKEKKALSIKGSKVLAHKLRQNKPRLAAVS